VKRYNILRDGNVYGIENDQKNKKYPDLKSFVADHSSEFCIFAQG
jgi:hypothetical protein